MNATLWLAAVLACAQPGPPAAQTRDRPEGGPPPRPAASRIVEVTVYQGQALVTREVAVPEGDGTLELVVTPLPEQVVDGSLYSEGADGLRVLSTRFRTRAVKEDTRQEVRAAEARIRDLEAEAQRLQKEVAVQEEDLAYLRKLEGFTGTALTGLTEKGRLDGEAIITLSRFIMEDRGTRTGAAMAIRRQLQANAEAADLARRQLAELSAGSGRTERDAVIVVHKTRRPAGAVRLGYLVGSATWSPQYRIRGAADPAVPIRLEYLAAVVQQTGEPWDDVRVTLSNARPSLDAAPPQLLPLKLAVAGAVDTGPIEAPDDRSQQIAAELAKAVDFSFKQETPLEDVIQYVRARTRGPAFPDGIPIYVDPIGLQEAEKTLNSTVTMDVSQVPLRTSLRLLLRQLGLVYRIKDGLLTITSIDSAESLDEVEGPGRGVLVAGTDPGAVPDPARGAGDLRLDRAAASEQAEELRVAPGEGPAPAPAGGAGPSVTFPIPGRLDLPSRRDPQLLEVARVEMPAEYYAKAVPVLTPQVYRLARLTNRSDHVLLPGEAAVYIGGDFVGRMRLPLVAAGEPFIAGFGVDPQVQVGRRLVRKSRSVQGGNQVFVYEFRIGLRNYRPGPVKVRLWDRLPRPQGEAVVVNLVRTSAELSTDALYQRTARMDNLLRWDIDVPKGTVGDKTLYVNYEFRLEYAGDFAPPRFVSGGLREGPIGGGAIGMGGMGGGMRSVPPRGD